MGLDDNPTVIKERRDPAPPTPPKQMEGQWLRAVVLKDGSDDAGLVEIGRPELAEERQFVVAISPAARTLISFASRINREAVRSLGALSNDDYGDILPQAAGLLISGLWLSVFGMIRAAPTAQLYPATLFMRVYFMVCIEVFYEATADPLFFVLIAVVGPGFTLTLTAYRVDRNTLARTSTGLSTKPAKR